MNATVFFSDVNELATLTNVFKVSGVPTDPATVTLTITDPTGAVTTPTPVHTGTGTYTANISCTITGIWTYLWEGTGTASDAIAGTWTVTTTALGQRYCSIEELKSRLAIPDTGDDFELQLAAESASREIDQICGRYFWQAADTRVYMPDSIYRQTTDDIVSVTSLKVDFDGDGTYETTWTQNVDYRLEAGIGQYNTTAKGEPWPYTGYTVLQASKPIPFVWPWSNPTRIQIQGVFGWPAVPSAVKQATLIMASDLLRRKDAPFGVAGFSEFGVVRIQQQPIILQLLRRYITPKRIGV
jgi:hypothetical protein